MRVRLSIQRNRLPLLKTLFAIDATADPPPTISKLLEQVNELIPLEGENWGLEDYVVTLAGYECLHYSKVSDVVKEDDELCIRPISTPEQRTRTLSGRYQINASGQHLTDGIPFGRSLIRAPNRPAVHIPPRKRRRLDPAAGVFALNDDNDQDVKLLEISTELQGDEDADTEDEDEDFVLGDSDDGLDTSEDSDVSDNEGDDAEEKAVLSNGSLPLGARSGSRRVSFSKIVDVEKDSHSILTGSSSSEAEDSEESEADSSSGSDGSSSDDDSSEDDGGSDALSASENSDDSSNSSDESSEDDDSPGSGVEKQLKADSQLGAKTHKAPSTLKVSSAEKPLVLPGEGKRETKKRNLRRRQKSRLSNLIKTGKLPANATVSDLEGLFDRSAGQPVDDSANDELETQRQRLLAQLQNGGIDITEDVAHKGNGQLVDPRSSEPTLPTPPHASGTSPSAAEMETKRPRLNLAGSNRLIFGSLGVRTPKSQVDGEKVRQKLAARGEVPRTSTKGPETPDKRDTEMAAATENNELTVLSDGWQSKLILKAVECVDAGTTLSQPPYPFVQCWDEQYLWNRPQDNRKKRKRRSRETSSYSEAYEDEEPNQEWTEDMYDDDLSAEAPPLSHTQGANSSDNVSFPPMPGNVEALPALAAQYCNAGSYVVYKELHVDASTKWQPEISGWRLARVEENLGEDGLRLILAPEHRVEELVRYDDAGRRIREGFEMPEVDDDMQEGGTGVVRANDGVRDVALESVVDLKLLEVATTTEILDTNAKETRAQPAPASTDAKGANGSLTNGDHSGDDTEWDGLGDENQDMTIVPDVLNPTSATHGRICDPSPV